MGNVVLHATFALALATGCDIVQGFQNAGDSLFPPQKTYLETPGFRLVDGGYRRLNVGVGDELYLFARSSEDADASLYAMRFVDPTPCAIPNVGRYWTSGLASSVPAQVAYLDGGERRGFLRFADARCRVSSLSFEDAELPFEENGNGIVFPAGRNLMMVNPARDTARTIETDVQAIFPNGPGVHLILAEGQLGAFQLGTWQPIGRVGNGVVSLRSVSGVYVFEDADGIHRLELTGTVLDASVSRVTLDAEGCRLGSVSGPWFAYYSPCDERRLTVWNVPGERKSTLEYTADPVYFEFRLDPGSMILAPDPAMDPYWFFSLRNVASGLGELVVRTPEAVEHVIGQGAAFERVSLDEDGEHGLALLDVVGETGRLVRWERDGTVTELASSVLRSSSELIVNWNGIVGDRARLEDDDRELRIVLEDVPRRDFVYENTTGRWRALFHDSDGQVGTLSIDASGSPTFANRRVVARRVPHPRHQFLDVVLPGIAYLDNYDALHDTGRLEYRNLELGFTGIVSEGVSDFIPAGNGILYTVPFGSAAGVWLARAK